MIGEKTITKKAIKTLPKKTNDPIINIRISISILLIVLFLLVIWLFLTIK